MIPILAIPVGAYLASCGAIAATTHGRRGGIEIAVPAAVSGIAAAGLWILLCVGLILYRALL